VIVVVALELAVLMFWMSVVANTASKAAVNLLSRSRIKNGKRRWVFVEVHVQVARQLGQPRSGRVRGDAQDVCPAGVVLDGRSVACGRRVAITVGTVAVRTDSLVIVRVITRLPMVRRG
jgi:hypothetical protein